MSRGFNNPAIDNLGNLHITSEQSPNFITGVAGWQIRKDGSAEFNNLTIRGTFKGTAFIINANGAFFYAPGAPGVGNLVASIAPVATTDPFGNGAGAGFQANNNTFGVVAQMSAGALQFFAGITQNMALNANGLNIFNTHGALIFSLDVTRDSLLIYSDTGSATQGSLIASIASKAATDSFGATINPGVTNYNAPPVGEVAQLFNGFLNLGTPAQMAGSGGAAPGQVGVLTGNPAIVRIDSGLTATGDLDSFLDVRSSNAQAAIDANHQRNIALAGPLALSVETNPVQLAQVTLWSDQTIGKPLFRAASGNDGARYELGVKTARTTGIQVVNSSTPAAITGLSIGIDVGDWIFESWIDLTADTSTFLGYLYIGGNATVSTMRAFVTTLGNAQPVTYKLQDTYNVNNSPAPVNFGLVAGTEYLNVIRGHLTCTAAGNLQVVGATSGGDGYTTHIRSILRAWPTLS